MTEGPSPDLGRRRLLKGLALAPLAVLCLPDALAAPVEPFWSQPRVLDLYRPALNRRVRTVYWANNQLQPQGYRELCELLKDQRAGQAVAMDPRLLDLLCAMQAWVGAYGFKEPIHINSGYRSPQTNSRLEGAAKNSMHLHGKAADIVFPGLPAHYVGQLAARYAGGGVGFYLAKDFIHVDTGRQRFWVR